MNETPDPWPLWRLVLRTPRLTLRPDDDEGTAALLAEALRGIHPPERMPFGMPWTDQAPADLVREGMKHHWATRAACAPDNWEVSFLVRFDGQVIGTQSLSGQDFAVRRDVATGSWLGMRWQGRGFGTEMRAAVLMLAFDHLGAHTARSRAFLDNAHSIGVSRKLGYQPDGEEVWNRRGVAATQQRLVLHTDRFVRPDWTLEVEGLDRAVFGAG
jgi:RimJ/RimL family protein N-acetyltransferase